MSILVSRANGYGFMTEIVETARPSVYHNGVQEQPPQLTRAQNHTNGHPNGRPFHKYIYMGPNALAPRHMVNGPLSNPPNGLPRVDFSDVMPRARSKLNLLHPW